MLDQYEIQYRTEARFVTKNIDRQPKLMTKVVYDELYPFFDYEKDMTGDHLRKMCEMVQDQLYVFPSPLGSTLEEMLKQNIRFSSEEIALIFNQLLLGLYEIHQQKTLGRCFHLGNIYCHLKKITFSCFGFYSNLPFHPPEYLQIGKYQQGIDMWLLGCILYQLCTGMIIKKFTNKKDYEDFYSRLSRQQIDSQFVNLLNQMLEPQEQKRISFGQLYSLPIISIKNEEIRQFYLIQFRQYNLNKIIEFREQLDDEYLQWAVPKEFSSPLLVPKIKIQLKIRSRFSSQQVNPSSEVPQMQNFSEPINPKHPALPYPLLGNLFEYFTIPIPEPQTIPEQQTIPVQQTIPEPQFNLSEQPIQQSIVREPKFLQFRNRDPTETAMFGEIWREFHFQSYRFHLIDSLKQQLEYFEQPYIKLIRYCLSKMLIILRREFLQNVSSEINFLQLPQDQWELFLQNSSQLKRQLSDLKNLLSTEQSLMETLFLEINRDQQMISEFEPAEQKLYHQIQDNITKSVAEKNFNDFKIPYRRAMQFLYDDIKEILSSNPEEDPRSFALLQLKTIICMTINTIFTQDRDGSRNTQNRETAFVLLKNFFGIQDLTCPSYVEELFENASLAQIKEQTKHIHMLYFSQNDQLKKS